MRKSRKIITKSALFALSLIFCLMLASVASIAASPTYNMSSDYKKGKYYENFRAVRMTGDGAHDTLAIALSQLGYHEGNDNAGRDGLSTDGNRDFVEYNVLYGKLDNNQGNGVSYGYYWCASFVNWCLRQAEVSREASAAAEVSCRRWLSACKDSGIYHEKDGYVPKSADLIFFKSASSSASSTHMGLVLRCDGNTVYTIEGNTSNGSEFSSNGNYVALKSYKLTSSYIVGYATPKYNVIEGIGSVDHSGASMSAGQYISTDKIDVFSDKSLATKLYSMSEFTVFTVDSVENGILTVNIGESGEIAYIRAENIKQISVKTNIRSISYLNSNGKKLYSNQYAEKGSTVTVTDEIPERSDAHFMGWQYGSDLIAPGDTLVFDESIELYAVYDDTMPPSVETTQPKPVESETETVTTEKIQTVVTEEKTEEKTEETTEEETEINTNAPTEARSEITEEFSAETDEITVTTSEKTAVTEDTSKESEHPVQNSQKSMLSIISSAFGCESALGGAAYSVLIASVAISATVFRKKKANKDKK